MLKIVDITDAVWDGTYRQRNWEGIEGAMIHRCGVDKQTGVVLGYDAPSICDAFLGRHPNPDYAVVAKATGGENAYSIYIGGELGPGEYDGKIWQALPLDEVGYHARRWSVPMLGIGLIFDGRYAAPSNKQYNSLTDLLVELSVALGWNPYKMIKGHGEVPKAHDGSKAPGQPAACPGDKLNMNVLRDDVAVLMRDGGRRRLWESGLVFGQS